MFCTGRVRRCCVLLVQITALRRRAHVHETQLKMHQPTLNILSSFGCRVNPTKVNPAKQILLSDSYKPLISDRGPWSQLFQPLYKQICSFANFHKQLQSVEY